MSRSSCWTKGWILTTMLFGRTADGLRLSIEGTVPPLFRCETCLQELLDQQAAMVDELQVRYPSLSVISTVHKLVNVVFVDLKLDDSEKTDDIYLIDGVRAVYRSENYFSTTDYFATTDNTHMKVDSYYSHPLKSIGLQEALEDICVNGEGVRIAVLDGGVDYTHIAMGGSGTREAYEAAYGTSSSDERNRNRDGLFPTTRVVAGKDFLGDRYSIDSPSFMVNTDDDPIDNSGHGTAVAHAIRAVAPAATLVAVKICASTGTNCPDFAYLQGLEYILDPDQDGSLQDRVAIVNISIGRDYASSYYSIVSRAVEEIHELGVLAVLAAGNSGNRPFILGGETATPNAISVGATMLHAGNYILKTMAEYSARGPGDVLKPDVVAPAGPYGLAESGTGNEYRTFLGTSFAAPLVTGAAALIKQKCPECSPFAVKCLLMNHGDTDILYQMDDERTAPVSWQGAGEIQIQRSLAATFWVFSVEDVNPSISLGVVNAAWNMILRRTLRITQLTDKSGGTIKLDTKFRSDQHPGAVTVIFSPSTLKLDGKCQSEYTVQVEYRIDASKAPRNRMASGGQAGLDPRTLDWNEVDGWILLNSIDDEKVASVPFHMILRQASYASMELTTILDETMNSLPAQVPLGLSNHGAATAQVDFYELIFISLDDPENPYGTADPPSDLRYVGYRTFESNIENCDRAVEIAIQTWEKQSSLAYTHFDILVDLDMDYGPEYRLFNSAYSLGSLSSEMRVQKTGEEESQCVGFVPDHSTNTATTVLRFCSNHIGMSSEGNVNIAISSYSFPGQEDKSDGMGYRKISLNKSGLSVAKNYNIEPNMRMEAVEISGSGKTPSGDIAMGLMVVTNAYRSASSTGAATRNTEVLVATREGMLPLEERTPDILRFPQAKSLSGPSCRWNEFRTFCRRRTLDTDGVAIHAPNTTVIERLAVRDLEDTRETCPELNSPRLDVVESGSVEEPNSPLFVPAPPLTSEFVDTPPVSFNDVGQSSGWNPFATRLALGMGLVHILCT